jgi:hypothetical protein
MSEAPRARNSHSPARFLARAFLLVLGTLAFLVLVGPRDARALDVGPVGGAGDQVAQPVGRVVDRVVRPARDVADRVADGAGRAVDQIAGPVGRLGGVAGQVRGAADQLGNQVEPVRDLVGGSPSGNRVEHDTPLPGSPDEPSPSEYSTGTRPVTEGSIQPSAPAGLPAPIDLASLSQPTGASDANFPPGSPWIPVGPSSTLSGGSWKTGGSGLPLNAALLAAALALAVAMSRWLRLSPDARALNPFLSRVEVPG